jgi:DNA invertase Pin-like site-specific DNA recombinase
MGNEPQPKFGLIDDHVAVQMQQLEPPQSDEGPVGLRAAQYVRMSTDHQKYSTENQAAAIAAYAVHRNLTIIRTYADHGRSGVRVDGRDGLRQLLRDVQSGQADFKLILVYDISRWGRFQDADESAYYEFICKEAGIRVAYCAEQFENDGSLVSAILKNMKRVMAGEYSRELSTKVSVGQCRGAALGFWQGGPAGYGMRRQLIDENGNPKGKLEYGQRKSFQADRVILVPGPQSEVKIIRRIFNSFVVEKKSRTQIAADLNAEKVTNARGRPWIMQTIDDILTNEKYIGHNVYGRGSVKLGQKCVANPPDRWIRKDNAFRGIIAPGLFAKAQKAIAERRYRRSDQEMLNLLSALWRKKGHLSVNVITSAKDVPPVSNYASRFGSLFNAYERIGYKLDPRYNYTGSRTKVEIIINSVVDDVVSNVERLGGSVTYLSELHLLTINQKLTVSIGVATCVSDGTIRSRRWQLRQFKYKKADFSLVLKMDEANTKIQAYYLLPTVNLPPRKNYRVRMASYVFKEEYRHDGMGAFYRMWTREGALPQRNSP